MGNHANLKTSEWQTVEWAEWETQKIRDSLPMYSISKQIKPKGIMVEGHGSKVSICSEFFSKESKNTGFYVFLSELRNNYTSIYLSIHSCIPHILKNYESQAKNICGTNYSTGLLVYICGIKIVYLKLDWPELYFHANTYQSQETG